MLGHLPYTQLIWVQVIPCVPLSTTRSDSRVLSQEKTLCIAWCGPQTKQIKSKYTKEKILDDFVDLH